MWFPPDFQLAEESVEWDELFFAKTNILTHLNYIIFFLLVPELYQVHTSYIQVSVGYFIALWYPQEFLMWFECSHIALSCVLLPEAVTQDCLFTVLRSLQSSHSFILSLIIMFFSLDECHHDLPGLCHQILCSASKKCCALRCESWSLKLWSCTAQVYSLACVVTKLKMMSRAGYIGIWSSVKQSACLMVAKSFPSNKWD